MRLLHKKWNPLQEKKQKLKIFRPKTYFNLGFKFVKVAIPNWHYSKQDQMSCSSLKEFGFSNLIQFNCRHMLFLLRYGGSCLDNACTVQFTDC